MIIPFLTTTMNRLFASILLALMTIAQCSAMTWLPGDMPNVQLADRREFVSDPGALLSPEATRQVNAIILGLRQTLSVEMAVAIPPSIGDDDPAQWTEHLFSLWKIGKSDKDNGVLLMISPESRAAFIMTGYGVEGALPDIACSKIYRREIIPAMKRGDLDAAVLNSVSLIAQALEDPAVAEELRSSQPDTYQGQPNFLDRNVLVTFVCGVAVSVGVVALIWFAVCILKARRRHDNYGKAEYWRSQLKTFGWLALISLGLGVPFWAAAFFAYRYWRTRKLKCPTCNAKMKRLPEDEDNQLLSDSQDFEEQLKTVDYDVWECPVCGTVDRYAYRADQKKYTECPSCHTVAMCLVSDVTTKAATVRSEGEGVKIYECRYCHHRHNKPYRIPKKEDPSAALAAAAALGAAASRGRGGGFGGGGFGGGFGGGATGGGGAGGRW